MGGLIAFALTCKTTIVPVINTTTVDGGIYRASELVLSNWCSQLMHRRIGLSAAIGFQT